MPQPTPAPDESTEFADKLISQINDLLARLLEEYGNRLSHGGKEMFLATARDEITALLQVNLRGQ